MYFQKVLKGIAHLSQSEAEHMVREEGIFSNWWRNKGIITPNEVKTELEESNLMHHLNDYDQTLPPGHRSAGIGRTYGDVSAFISVTAGSIQRRAYASRNILYPPFITALEFATEGFRTSGYIFYCYVLTLGRKSIPFECFSEEVRELHIYSHFLPFQHEGEITAKVHIPSVNIEKAEFYDGPLARQEFLM